MKHMPYHGNKSHNEQKVNHSVIKIVRRHLAGAGVEKALNCKKLYTKKADASNSHVHQKNFVLYGVKACRKKNKTKNQMQYVNNKNHLGG